MDMITPRVLVVDDEPFNLEILSEHLEDESFIPVCAESGEAAWAILNTDEGTFSTILLDWMMPGMSGLELLKLIKQEPQWKTVPVIMQTAKADKESVNAGLEAGAYYYLSKPYDKETLMSIVRAAVEDQRALATPVTQANTDDTATLDNQSIQIQTLEEARTAIEMICKSYPDKPELGLGLTELVLNGIEHGNLGITYKEKGALIAAESWEDEVNRRLAMAENQDKHVRIEIDQDDREIRFTITDQGPGFNWLDYLEFSADRAFDTHGRGIAMANAMSFESVEYQGKGNVVVATTLL